MERTPSHKLAQNDGSAYASQDDPYQEVPTPDQQRSPASWEPGFVVRRRVPSEELADSADGYCRRIATAPPTESTCDEAERSRWRPRCTS